MRLYALQDLKMVEFGAVMQFQNNAVAVRWLKDHLPPQSMESRHPEDFLLIFLGVMDLSTGVIASGTPEVVGKLSDLLVQPVSPLGEE